MFSKRRVKQTEKVHKKLKDRLIVMDGKWTHYRLNEEEKMVKVLLDLTTPTIEQVDSCSTSGR